MEVVTEVVAAVAVAGGFGAEVQVDEALFGVVAVPLIHLLPTPLVRLPPNHLAPQISLGDRDFGLVLLQEVQPLIYLATGTGHRKGTKLAGVTLLQPVQLPASVRVAGLGEVGRRLEGRIRLTEARVARGTWMMAT